MAAVAHISEAHFSRTFRAVFGETPHRYLQRRRVERSMFLLRETERSVTDICFDVGFSSLGTFSRTFREIVGETPSGYRTGHGPIVAPHCVQLAAMRPGVAARVAMQSSSAQIQNMNNATATMPSTSIICEGYDRAATRATGRDAFFLRRLGSRLAL